MTNVKNSSLNGFWPASRNHRDDRIFGSNIVNIQNGSILGTNFALCRDGINHCCLRRVWSRLFNVWRTASGEMLPNPKSSIWTDWLVSKHKLQRPSSDAGPGYQMSFGEAIQFRHILGWLSPFPRQTAQTRDGSFLLLTVLYLRLLLSGYRYRLHQSAVKSKSVLFDAPHFTAPESIL